MTPITVREAAIKAGGFTALAHLLSVSRQTVHRWDRENSMPEIYQYAWLALRPRRKRAAVPKAAASV